MSVNILETLPSEQELRRELARRYRENNLLRSLIKAMQRKAKIDKAAQEIRDAQRGQGGAK